MSIPSSSPRLSASTSSPRFAGRSPISHVPQPSAGMSAPEDKVMQRAVMDIASARLPLTPIGQGSYTRRYNGRNSGFLAYALGQFHHQRFVTATRRARRMPARLSRYLRASCHGGKRSRDRSRRRSGPPDYPRNPLYQSRSVPGTNLLESAHPPPAQALRAQRRRQIRAYRLGRSPRYHRPPLQGYLDLLPGTDAALALGMMHVLIAENLVDHDYVNRYTLGFDQLKERVLEYPPRRVAHLTGLSEEAIVGLARDYGTIRPAAIRLNYGMQRHAGGGMAMRTE